MLKLHHVDATSRHVDFMSISNSDVLERGSYPSRMSIEVWNLIWMCTPDMYIFICRCWGGGVQQPKGPQSRFVEGLLGGGG